VPSQRGSVHGATLPFTPTAPVADQTGMKGIILAIVATALCTAGVCFVAFKSSPASSATIDGSTEEVFKASINTVKQALPQPRQEEFEQAMTALAGAVMLPPKDGNPLASIMGLSADPGAPGRKLRTRVHGMTGSEIIAAGDAAAAEMKERGANANGLAAIASLGLGGAVASGAVAEARLNANESAAIATLKNISSAQAQCQASGVIDANGNGAGEYGFFAELAGRTPVRGSTHRIEPPVMSSAFGKVDGSRLTRSGYVFQMFLPDAKAAGVVEAPTGGSDGVAVDHGQAEVLWCCYAWPTDCGKSGKRAFFINQSGDVLACSNTSARYNGWDKGPDFTAAFQRGTKTMADPVAANTAGNNGETWLVVN
jgi:hypothetical protein